MSITEKLLSTPKLWERENDIIQWGVDRNIIGDNAQATFESQQEKTRQEWGEWKRDHSMDDCGDLFVTLVMGAALKGTTVSECVGSCDLRSPLGVYNEKDVFTQEELLDVMIDDYLNIGRRYYASFKTDVAYVIHTLMMNATKRGWTLEECIEVAWEDIKDRKGKMIHGLFVKQKDLDALSELGVEVVEDNGEVYFEGHFKKDRLYSKALKVLTDLGLDSEELGFLHEVGGICLKSTGRI